MAVWMQAATLQGHSPIWQTKEGHTHGWSCGAAASLGPGGQADLCSFHRAHGFHHLHTAQPSLPALARVPRQALTHPGSLAPLALQHHPDRGGTTILLTAVASGVSAGPGLREGNAGARRGAGAAGALRVIRPSVCPGVSWFSRAPQAAAAEPHHRAVRERVEGFEHVFGHAGASLIGVGNRF